MPAGTFYCITIQWLPIFDSNYTDWFDYIGENGLMKREASFKNDVYDIHGNYLCHQARHYSYELVEMGQQWECGTE